MHKNECARSLCMGILLVFCLSSCTWFYCRDPFYGLPHSDLVVAVHSGNAKKVRSVLKHHPDLVNVDVAGQTPLECAAVSNYVEIARILLDHGANVNQRVAGRGTPLLAALSFSAFEKWDTYNMVVLLVDHGADVNAKLGGSSVLHYAARGRSVRVLDVLLAKGAAVNANPGWTPLMGAAESGWYDGVKFLLEHGADPLARDYLGRTARFRAESPVNSFGSARNEPRNVQEVEGIIALLKGHEERKKKELEGAQR